MKLAAVETAATSCGKGVIGIKACSNDGKKKKNRSAAEEMILNCLSFAFFHFSLSLSLLIPTPSSLYIDNGEGGSAEEKKLHRSPRLFLIMFFVPLTNRLTRGSSFSCRRNKAVLLRRRRRR